MLQNILNLALYILTGILLTTGTLAKDLPFEEKVHLAASVSTELSHLLKAHHAPEKKRSRSAILNPWIFQKGESSAPTKRTKSAPTKDAPKIKRPVNKTHTNQPNTKKSLNKKNIEDTPALLAKDSPDQPRSTLKEPSFTWPKATNQREALPISPDAPEIIALIDTWLENYKLDKWGRYKGIGIDLSKIPDDNGLERGSWLWLNLDEEFRNDIRNQSMRPIVIGASKISTRIFSY